jgi:hypothetical protein
MQKNDYHKTVNVSSSSLTASKKVSEITWWIRDYSGKAEKKGDTFRVSFGNVDGEPAFVDFTVSELMPGIKTAWKVNDCHLPWFNDKKEWNNTEVVFEFSEENGNTTIDFTHIGLVPEVECYSICESGWNGHINNLAKFIDEN